MSMMECKNCHRIADARCFRACSDCGAPLCDDCANEYAGLCRDCDEGCCTPCPTGGGRWRG